MFLSYDLDYYFEVIFDKAAEKDQPHFDILSRTHDYAILRQLEYVGSWLQVKSHTDDHIRMIPMRKCNWNDYNAQGPVHRALKDFKIKSNIRRKLNCHILLKEMLLQPFENVVTDVTENTYISNLKGPTAIRLVQGSTATRGAWSFAIAYNPRLGTNYMYQIRLQRPVIEERQEQWEKGLIVYIPKMHCSNS